MELVVSSRLREPSLLLEAQLFLIWENRLLVTGETEVEHPPYINVALSVLFIKI